MYAKQTQTNHNAGGMAKLVMLVCVLAVLVSSVYAFTSINAKTTAPPLHYEDLEISDHTITAHGAQAWDAYRIRDFFIAGNCKPKIDICANGREIHSCKINDFSIGLIIDRWAKVIVTGFAARVSYWNNVHNRCNAGGA